MPNGKKAGERCLHLNDSNLCGLFNKPERPTVCSSFKASTDICGSNRDEAVKLIQWYENATR